MSEETKSDFFFFWSQSNRFCEKEKKEKEQEEKEKEQKLELEKLKLEEKL